MDVLIVYYKTKFVSRKMYTDQLYSFKRYNRNFRFFYLNMLNPHLLTDRILNHPFSAVIFHQSYLELRYDTKECERCYTAVCSKLGKLRGMKAIIPHDDYYMTQWLWEMINACGVTYVFSCCPKSDQKKLYPEEKCKGVHIVQVYAGYVEDQLVKKLQNKKLKRKIDVGYRARNNIFQFGKHGTVKVEIANCFIAALKGNPRLKSDIHLTYGKDMYAITGNKWIRFLLNCRATLGCLGGSGILDVDGEVKKQIDCYLQEHPMAKFEEVQNACFPGRDGEINYFVLSPRHFECAITKTCQILYEGDYGGVIEPDIDYIELKKDYSNIEQVIERLEDIEYCEHIAEHCYKKIVLSKEYRYSAFSKLVLDNLYAGQEDVSVESIVLLYVSQIPFLIEYAVLLLYRSLRIMASTIVKSKCPKAYENIKRHFGKG